MPAKTREKKANPSMNGLQKPLQPSQELAAVVGSSPLARGQVVSKMWEYIRSHNLQNPENRREILLIGGGSVAPRRALAATHTGQ